MQLLRNGSIRWSMRALTTQSWKVFSTAMARKDGSLCRSTPAASRFSNGENRACGGFGASETPTPALEASWNLAASAAGMWMQNAKRSSPDRAPGSHPPGEFHRPCRGDTFIGTYPAAGAANLRPPFGRIPHALRRLGHRGKPGAPPRPRTAHDIAGTPKAVALSVIFPGDIHPLLPLR
jgi:hypothetical protein